MLHTLIQLARTSRSSVHAGMWLMDRAERLETALDALAVRAGHTVEDVYAPLRHR
jgi:hypothetical protein